jgi:hypothetical protein
VVYCVEYQWLTAPPEESDPAVRIQSPENPADIIHVTRGLHDHVNRRRAMVKELVNIVNLIAPFLGKGASE